MGISARRSCTIASKAYLNILVMFFYNKKKTCNSRPSIFILLRSYLF
jgi:hypothetical protein